VAERIGLAVVSAFGLTMAATFLWRRQPTSHAIARQSIAVAVLSLVLVLFLLVAALTLYGWAISPLT